LIRHILLVGLSQEAFKAIKYKRTVIAGKIKKHKPNGEYQQITLFIPRSEETRQEIHRTIRAEL